MRSYLSYLECTACGETYSAEEPHTICPRCGKVLFARYDLEAAKAQLDRDALARRPRGMWRWFEIMPVRNPDHVVTLGEGDTPLLPAGRLGEVLGSGNPSAGNAAAALAAYGARAGMRIYQFMPQDVPEMMRKESHQYGAHAYLVRGLINDAGRMVREGTKRKGWFDVSTLREPYRQEGKKTMGLELAEHFGWTLPDAIIYPTGGGTGLVGMWKAFHELEQLGWIGPKRPKMIVVQAEGCAPIVRAYQAGQRHAELFPNAHTIAPGIRVPVAIGDYLILDAVRASGGTAVAVSDAEIMRDMREMARLAGVFASPEGAATLSAYKRLRASGFLSPDDVTVLFNCGSAFKNAELIQAPTLPVLDPNDPAWLDQVA
jgi:threonine synthase